MKEQLYGLGEVNRPQSFPAREEGATFFLGESAPDTVLLADLERVVEAVPLHGALGADLLRPLLTTTLVRSTLQAGRREEDAVVRTTAGCPIMPKFFSSLCAHKDPPLLGADFTTLVLIPQGVNQLRLR